MHNAKIDLGTSVPLLAAPSEGTDGERDIFTAARSLKTAVWIFDIDRSRILYANASACRLWNAENEQVLRNRDMAEDMSSTVAKRLKQYQIDFIERGATFNEMWTLYPDGIPTSVMVIFRGFGLPDGRMAMQCEVLGNADDEPANLRSAEALLHTDVMITLYERNGPALYMNPAARNVATQSLHSISEKFVDPVDYDTLVYKVERLGEHRMVARVHTVAGPKWHDVSAKQCSDAVTGKPAVLVTAIDVSELKIARDKARYLADRDQLTGCFNRAYLLQHVALLEEYQSDHCALLCFDIDQFKQINDRLGHEMGDVVLKEISSRLKRQLRRSDVIVRLGGDEFVIIIENAPPDAELVPVFSRLLNVISQPISHETIRVSATVSMGVTTFSPRSIDFDAVMRRADIALYASKQAGRNRVTVFSEEMSRAVKERDLIEMDLKQSVENREFELYFQPRVNLKSGQVVSVEGLLRWHHPERGMIMPGDFISICEETGLIEELGQLVLELGCTQAIAWQQAGLTIGLSLNISPRQFDDHRLLTSLRRFSQHPDFPSGRIELEITETVLIGDHGEIEKKLEAIADMGYRIAIDDFGTGYSNLSYISRFPLNCLKIDQSFIAQLPKSGPIINLILTLARQIDATVVAEGVETQEQLDWLRAHDCDQAQGYYLSYPVEGDILSRVVDDLNARGCARADV